MSFHSRREFTRIVMMAGVAATGAARSASGSATPLFDQARDFLDSRRDAALGAFLLDWPAAGHRRKVVPVSLPVLRWLPEVKAHAPEVSAALVNELSAAAPRIAWRQTYHAPDVDEDFLSNYGWSELVGLQGEFASTRIACGFLLLGPTTRYPRHRHEAEEIYVPLAGTALWQQGDGVWRERPPGTVIHHASDEPHAMRTDEQPLLAIYLWRSTHLNQKARLDPGVD